MNEKYTYVKIKVLEDETIEIKDGATSIYLSTRGENKEDVSDELVTFLNYVRDKESGNKKDYGDAFIKQLQEFIVEIKNSREWGDKYMGLQELLDEEYEDGLEKGKAIGLSQGKALGEREKLISQVRKKLDKGKTLDEIADILEEDIGVISEIVNEITEK